MDNSKLATLMFLCLMTCCFFLLLNYRVESGPKIWKSIEQSKIYQSLRHDSLLASAYRSPIVVDRVRRGPFAEDSKPDDLYTVHMDVVANDTKETKYFKKFGDSTCFISGINLIKSRKLGKCICQRNYFGDECGIPYAVWAREQNNLDFRVRLTPRRVVMGLVVNHELDLTEVRFNMLKGIVDAYIISEGTVSSAGLSKELLFFQRFQKGFLRDFHHKIVYIKQNSFPNGYIEDGWKADDYVRTFMSEEGLRRIGGLREDDLFLNFDADEIPNPEVVLFLKLYDGFTNPIEMTFHWSVYGFFWLPQENDTPKMNSIIIGSTMKFLHEVCDDNVIWLRRNPERRCPGWQTSSESKKTFSIGVPESPAGFHCSWCFSSEGIRWKLMSAQKADKPRWGDYPEKLKLDYIENLVRKGEWFDGSSSFKRVSETSIRHFAPKYMLKRRKMYTNFLLHPDDRGTNKSVV